MPITIDDLKTVDTYKRALMRDVPHIPSGTVFHVYCGGKNHIENVKLPGLGFKQEIPFLLLFGQKEITTVTDWLRSQRTELIDICGGTCSLREGKLILDLYPGGDWNRTDRMEMMCKKISKLLVNISVETVSMWFVTDKTGRSWGMRTMKEVVLEQTGRPLRPINPAPMPIGEDNLAARKAWSIDATAKLNNFFEEKYHARSHPDTWMCYDIVNDFLQLLEEIKPRDQLAVENVKTRNGTVAAYNSVYHKITQVTVKALEAKQQAISRMADERIRKGEYARVRETFEKLAGDLRDTMANSVLPPT